MVTSAYMTARSRPPSMVKRVFDQDVIPAGINIAGAIEGTLWRAGERTRRTPVIALLTAIVFGYLVRGLIRRM